MPPILDKDRILLARCKDNILLYTRTMKKPKAIRVLSFSLSALIVLGMAGVSLHYYSLYEEKNEAMSFYQSYKNRPSELKYFLNVAIAPIRNCYAIAVGKGKSSVGGWWLFDIDKHQRIKWIDYPSSDQKQELEPYINKFIDHKFYSVNGLSGLTCIHLGLSRNGHLLYVIDSTSIGWYWKAAISDPALQPPKMIRLDAQWYIF